MQDRAWAMTFYTDWEKGISLDAVLGTTCHIISACLDFFRCNCIILCRFGTRSFGFMAFMVICVFWLCQSHLVGVLSNSSSREGLAHAFNYFCHDLNNDTH
jgi:hypothetical protein